GHFLRGQVLRSLGSNDDAVKAFLEVLKLNPDTMAALLQLADINLSTGDARAAADFAAQATKVQPNSGIAHLFLARAQLRLGNLTGAEREVMGLAKGSPGSPDAQIVIGDYYYAKEDLTRARESYDAALKLQNGSIDALAGLIRIDLKQKKPDA